MAKFNSLFSKINPNYSPEEMEALSEPSIMDEYIKQNDPEQYDKIQGAKNIKFAMDSAMNAGPTIGSLKNIAPKLGAKMADPDLLAEPARRITKEEMLAAKQYMQQNPPEDAVRRMFEKQIRSGDIEIPDEMKRENLERLLKSFKNE